jgi:hypothetical protein
MGQERRGLGEFQKAGWQIVAKASQSRPSFSVNVHALRDPRVDAAQCRY